MKNPFVNFLLGFVAVILSLILIMVAVTDALFYTGADLLKADHVAELLHNVTQTAVVSHEVFQETAEEKNVSDELVNDILESELFEEVVYELSEDFTAELLGEDHSGILTTDDLKALTSKHMDEIYEIVDSHYEQDISREKLESGIMNALDENKEDINETLASSVMVVEEIDDGLLSILRIIFGSTATIMLTVTTIVLALLIYACRYRRFGGFIWLGVDFILVSLMVFGIRSALDFAAELMMAEAEISTSVSSLIVPILKILDKDLNTAVIIYTVIAIALIAVGIVLKKTVGKKKIAQ